MKRNALAVLLIICFTNNLLSQEPKEIVDGFYKVLKEKSSYEAIDVLFDANDIVEIDMNVRENVKTRVYSMVKNAGKLNGYELVKEERLASCIQKVTYVFKYDKKPILFEFEFYKPKEVWEVLAMKPIRSTNNLSLRGSR